MRPRNTYQCLVVVSLGILLLPWAGLAQAPSGKIKPAPVQSKTALALQEAAKANREAQDVAAVESAPLYREARYQPSNRRDPFLSPVSTKKNGASDQEEAPRGPAPPGIASMHIAQVKLVGTSVGNDSQTAVFEGTDQRVYFLRAGDRLYDGFVKSIEPDFVVMIRETLYKSGKTTTEEITLRLRTP